MNTSQHQTSQSGGFNPLLLRQQTASNQMKMKTDAGGHEHGQGPSQRAFGGGNTSTADPGTNRTQYFSSMQRQTNNGANSQQPQQQQQSQQLSDAARNQLVSLALTGDLAKALQLANFAGLQEQGRNGGLNLAGNNRSGGMGSNGGGNQQFFQGMQRSNNPLQSLCLGKSQSQPEQQTESAGQQPEHQTSKSSSLPFAKVGALDSTGPEVKKSAHSVVVPCRARGMTMEHNFQTACFVIREDIKHGDGLICSFPACRNRGVKFLYCAFCRDPVAKRNFRNRHSHNERQEDAGDQKSTSSNQVASSSPEDTEGRGGPHLETIVTGSQISDTSGFVGKSKQSFERQGTKRPVGAISDVTDPADEIIAKRLAMMGAKRQDAWAILLGQRPSTDDGDDMSAWLMQIMAVSDMKNPVPDSPTHMGAELFKPMMYKTMGQGSNDSSTSSEMDVNDSSSERNASNESSTPSESSSSNDSSNDSVSDENQAGTNDSASETQDPTNP